MTKACSVLLFLLAAPFVVLGQDPNLGELKPGTQKYREAVAARESLRQPPDARGAKETASKILADKRYSDPGASQRREMLESTKKETAGLFERMGAALNRLISKLTTSSGPGGTLPVSPWMWIGVAALVVLGFVVGWLLDRRGKARLAAGLVDEDDEGMTADQWLDRADNLTAQGFYRDAYRCLYVALLVRLSEYRIVPFRRYETNWEHVRRAERNEATPSDLDLRGTTRQFDLYWYGRREIGRGEVDAMREKYVRAHRVLEGRGT